MPSYARNMADCKKTQYNVGSVASLYYIFYAGVTSVGPQEEKLNNVEALNQIETGQALAGNAVEKRPVRLRNRRPSEKRRVKEALNVIIDAGLSPSAVRYSNNGEFEIFIGEKSNYIENDPDQWISENLAAFSK